MSGSDLVKFLDLGRVNAAHRGALIEGFTRVLDSGWYIQGPELQAFEREFAAYLGVKRFVGVGNGLDALTLMLRAEIELGRLSLGDAVLVPANTYIATILSVTSAGLVPRLVEPDPLTFNLDPEQVASHLDDRVRGILTVHLYGRIGYDERLRDLVERQGLRIWEDVAQAPGATWRGVRAGALGHAGAFSFYPGKNIGALGDAGGVATDDEDLAEMIDVLGNYGSRRKYVNEVKGVNSRLDELQAALLRAKLPALDVENEARVRIARRYDSEIRNPAITLPSHGEPGEHVWHLFVVRCARRDDLQAHLTERGIGTLIHYPIPPHRQDAYAEFSALERPITEAIHREVISLPMDPRMTDAEVDRVVAACDAFA